MNAEQEQTYDESDNVCWACFEDVYLQEQVKATGEVQACCVCKKTREAISIEQFSEVLSPILRENFSLGPEHRVFDGVDDDSGHYEQQGEDLSDIVQQVLGQYLPFHDMLIESLIDNDPADPRDGEEPFFTDYTMYVERRVELYAHYAMWNDAQNELAHRHRYFSGLAKEFFDWLFDNVENASGPADATDEATDVVFLLEVGSAIFRARACDSQTVLREIVTNPGLGVGPPPPEHARAGRMNADGVPVFYGALDLETCIAELRGPMGGRVAVAKFETTRPLRLLDFRRLQRAHWGTQSLSYFQPGFALEVEKREFTRRLHSLIRAPVLPGHESEYQITQAMAEYLSHVRKQRFDGLVFESAQREGGANVVLFPVGHGRPGDFIEAEGNGRGPLRYVADSLVLHSIERIEYRSAELRYIEMNDGRIVTHNPNARDDDDD